MEQMRENSLPEVFSARAESVVRHREELEALGVRQASIARAFDFFGIHEGDRFVIDRAGRWSAVINEYLMARSDCRPSTRVQFALELARVEGALASVGRTLLDADRATLGRYRRARLEGPHAVTRQRWDWERAVLHTFYEYLIAEGLVRGNPVRPWGVSGRRGTTRSSNANEIRYLSRAAFRFFRDHGLRRLPHAEDEVPVAQSRSPERDATAAATMVLTGLRPGELVHLCWFELPGGGPTEFDLAPDITKGGFGRRVLFTDALAQEIRRYVITERATLVERAQPRLRRQLEAGFLTRCVAQSGDPANLLVAGLPRKSATLLKSERRRLVVDRDGVLDPAVLFLSRGATPLSLHALEESFRHASARCRRIASSPVPASVTPHMARHTFAVHLLSGLLAAVAARADHPRKIAELPELLVQAPIRAVQTRLGHASPLTTYGYLLYVDSADQDMVIALSEITDLLDRAMTAGGIEA